VSFWYHFGPDAISGSKAVEAHIRHVETYDLDFLKVMCDGRYPLPHRADGIIDDLADLDRLAPMRGDEDIFGRHLQVLQALSQRFAGELWMATTIFNSWSTLRRLMASDIDVHGPPTRGRVVDLRDAKLSRFLAEAPDVLAKALGAITQTLSAFARNCLAAGANGVYLSVRDDWVDTPENGVGVYDRLVRGSDQEILAGAAGGALNILHVCGKPLDFRRFGQYPVQVLNWADRIGGPSIADVAPWLDPAICCGVDNLGTLVSGSPSDIEGEVIDAAEQAAGRPIIIAPGCTFDAPAVAPSNLRAIRRAVEHLAH
ncbi:MAG: uroporphyrinogen decarboxylase family protein, partial [Thermoguttaceae bacterium]